MSDVFQLRPAEPLRFRPMVGVAPGPRRLRIWELAETLHCSVIGTCLSMADLRHILGKVGLADEGASEHDLHAGGVRLAARQDFAAKLLTKALDQRHRVAINQFAKAHTEDELRRLWQEARRRGDIPGAYWAVLTHPASGHALIRQVFGEVHMLSHLVGAANRADVRQLAQLAEAKAALEAKVQRQQAQLRDAMVARDARIRELSDALAREVAAAPVAAETGESAALRRLVADLQRRLGTETARRQTADGNLAATRAELARERARREAAEAREGALTQEMQSLEAALDGDAEPAEPQALAGRTILYVGGRTGQVPSLRPVAERLGATLLHHDGGVEERGTLLAGLVGRADAVLFPVDCVSHAAAIAVKRLCRRMAKPYVPLRSGGVASLLVGLARLAP